MSKENLKEIIVSTGMTNEKYVKNIKDEVNQKKHSFLLKLFDRAEIINVGEI